MEMQISNATEFPLYHHSMATGPHSFQLPGAIPPVSTIPTYKNAMFPDRLGGFYYDSAGGVTHHHAMPAERCDRCYVELSVTGGGHHFGKRLCGMCAAKEQQQVSPKVDTEILDLDSQQVMSQQQQRQQQQQQQQDTTKAFLQQHGGVVVPPGYDRPPQPPPPPPPAVEWPGYFQPQQNTLSGEHLSPDYNNVSTTTTTPPTMMGGSPPSDMQQQQQQYQANFDGGGGGGYAIDSNQPPGVGGGGGSGSGGGGSGTKGNGSWKSNEARRAKTYECPACDKWFTSSGHLKRHYGTQLHKNAVKQSGKPDPALLPMKHHYHPYRDPAYVAQQKLKQQQQNGSSLHKQQQQQQQQQSSMMMPADFRPVTSSTSSSFNTDSFLEQTPPNLTASLSDSLGGTHYLPARRPVSNSSSSSSNNSNSNSNSTAGFTDEMQISSYPPCNSNKYRADLTVVRTAARHPATSFPGHRLPTAGQQALSAYLHHQITDTIQPYTTQGSMIQTPTNTDLYTTMPDNSGHHLYHHHPQQQPPPYHQQQHGSAREQLLHRQLPPLPPSPSRHHRQPVNRQQTVIDYQQPSSTTVPSPYQQQQHHHHNHHNHHQQQQQPSPQPPPPPQQQQQQQPHPHQHLQQLQRSVIKQEPVDYNNADDAPMASPDSSIDHQHHHQNHHHHQHQQHHQHHVQQQHRRHHHHQYSGLLVVAPASPASPPPGVPLLTTLHPASAAAAAAADDDAAVSDCSAGSLDLDADGSPQSLCAHVLSSPSSSSSSSKKLRKATRVKCDICNKDFTDKCYKTQHDQRFHSGEKPYRCGVCGKRFGEHKLLQVHELRHNDSNKAFPCTVCTKSFNFKNDLDRHFMSSHSADKPYQCVQCDKKFVRLDHKRHHEKTHDDAVDKTKNKKKKVTASSPVADGHYGGQLHIAEDVQT